MNSVYDQLIAGNKSWASRKIREDPGFFRRQAKGEQPSVLWIGCSDSRVPANEITGTGCGDMCVHRNMANMVIHDDMSLLAVLDHAVTTLNVRHIIICGHYGCESVQAAMSDKEGIDLKDNWIKHIRDVYRIHGVELEKFKDMATRFNRFVELNVIEQMIRLSRTSVIRKAAQAQLGIKIHGWVYDVHSGVIRELGSILESK